MAIAKSNDDLREVGEDFGLHRVARLTRRKSLRSQTADRRRSGKHGGKPAVASPNLLKRQFDVVEPNKAQVNTITYIRTYEGWMYLAVVLSLAGQCGEAGGDGSLRQGSKYSSSNWRNFLKANNLVANISRRCNCHDNAVAKSFFQLLKREQIKRKIYTTRQDAHSDVLDYTEVFCTAKRRDGFKQLAFTDRV